jgi:signal peptide peptidase SppA
MTNAALWRLAAPLFNAPVALHLPVLAPEGLTVGHVLRALGLAGEAAEPAPAAAFGEARERSRGYEVLDGIAVVPVLGVLVARLGTPYSYGYVTGYDGIRQNVADALADPDVKAIALQVDSPGGEVRGLFDLVDALHAMRGQKPLHAIVVGAAYSAAYALASAADRVLVPRTGGTGSIGVIALHADFSRMLDEAGITVTLLFHGARKADGNPYQPLADAARARFQRSIDAMGELFIATVARNRGLAADAIRAQQAGTFDGEDGVAQGLADAVMTPDAAFAELHRQLG